MTTLSETDLDRLNDIQTDYNVADTIYPALVEDMEWLCSLIRRLDKRVVELEQGGSELLPLLPAMEALKTILRARVTRHTLTGKCGCGRTERREVDACVSGYSAWCETCQTHSLHFGSAHGSNDD